MCAPGARPHLLHAYRQLEQQHVLYEVLDRFEVGSCVSIEAPSGYFIVCEPAELVLSH